MHPALSPLCVLLLHLPGAGTLVVDPGGGGDYTTIQEAIDNASPGDTILIMPGVYVEDLVVHTTVTLIGSGPSETIVLPATSVPGTGVGSQIDTTTQMCIVQAHGVGIYDIAFDGDNPNLGSGIDARNGIITDYRNGPWNDLTVFHCEVRNVLHRGIYATGGSGHLFQGNLVRNCRGLYLESAGIMFWASTGRILGNDVADCSLAVATHAGSSALVQGNVLARSDLGVLANGTSAPQEVTGNHIEGCAQGVQLIGINADVTVQDNDILSCTTGVTFFGSNAQGLILGNRILGDRSPGSSGIFATTDLSPWGYNDVRGLVQDTELAGLDYGVVCDETVGQQGFAVLLQFGGDPAHYNLLHDNVSFNLYLQNADDPIAATHNFWGVATAPMIEPTIWHQPDDPALGLVDFSSPVPLVVTVDDDGPADFDNIQDAVNQVLPGGTVQVAPGEYVQSVVVDRSLVLAGAGTDPSPLAGTILRGDAPAPGPGNDVLAITGPGVEVRDLRVDAWSAAHGDRYGAAIVASNTDGAWIHDVVVERGTYGIYSYYSTSTVVESSEIVDCGVSLDLGGGIFFRGSTGRIGGPRLGNLVRDGMGTGILSHNGSAAEVVENRVERCPLGYLSNGAAGPTLFLNNDALDCGQGYQAVADGAPVDYVGNVAQGGIWNFVLYGLGTAPHDYTGNLAVGGVSMNLFVDPHTTWGSSDVHAVFRDNTFADSMHGLRVDEENDPSFLVDLDFDATGGGTNRLTGHSLFHVYLDGADDDVPMEANYWGTQDLSSLEDLTWHKHDDPALGLVDFLLPRPAAPDLRIHSSPLGREVLVVVTGEPGDPFTLVAALGPGTLSTPYGDLDLDRHSARRVLDDVIPASGAFVRRLSVPRGAGSADGREWHVQGVVAGLTAGITNKVVLTLYSD